MSLTEQTISGANEISLTDSLNASLMKLKVTLGASATQTKEGDLLICVDKASRQNPTDDKKQYLFDLEEPLRYVSSVSDELLQEIKIVNNDVVMETSVIRNVGVNADETYYVLDAPVRKIIDAYPVTLFEGTNYIYTNYDNVNIEIVYPKDTDENKMFLNNATYYNHKIKNDGEFSLEDIYFKDAFTKMEDKLNLEVDNVKVGCITSKNNKFSLDSEGNMVVNSLTTVNDSSINNESICNLIYPVGSIYMSVNSANPATLFGGVWEQLKDRFLLGTGNTYSNGTTGGEATHKLTINEMPSHKHNVATVYPFNFGGMRTAIANSNVSDRTGTAYDVVDDTGGSQAHNNMPPYLVVYMWKRVS